MLMKMEGRELKLVFAIFLITPKGSTALPALHCALERGQSGQGERPPRLPPGQLQV